MPSPSKTWRAGAREFGLRGQRAMRALAGMLLLILLQWSAAPAFAHASLIDAVPPDGAMLNALPASVQLRFNEPVAALVFKLVLPDGSTQAVEQVVASADRLTATLPRASARGAYLLSWRVVSADGHPVGGVLGYFVGVAPTAAAASALPSGSGSGSVAAAIWLTRWGLYVALFLGIGATVFRAFIGGLEAPPARWSRALLGAGLALLPLALAVQGLDALAQPWHTLGSLQTWQTALHTAYGGTLTLMLAALLAAFVGGSRKAGIARPAALLALLLLGAALTTSGHASSAPSWLARPAVFVHAVLIAFWIGALLPLLMALAGSAAHPALQRFSRIIPWVLAPLLISGAALALLQLDRIQSLWLTDYGRILSAKLLLVLILLAVAAVNRYRLTAPVALGDPRARRSMRRLIGAELLLVLLILALVATWRFTPPPRALAPAAGAVISMHLHQERAMVDLVLTPQPERRLRGRLFIQGSDFGTLEPQQVTLEFSNPALGIETLQKEARQQADGSWLTDAFSLPASGHWQVRVGVLISDFERIELEQQLDLAP